MVRASVCDVIFQVQSISLEKHIQMYCILLAYTIVSFLAGFQRPFIHSFAHRFGIVCIKIQNPEMLLTLVLAINEAVHPINLILTDFTSIGYCRPCHGVLPWI